MPPSGQNGQRRGSKGAGFNAAGIAIPFPAVINTIVLIIYERH